MRSFGISQAQIAAFRAQLTSRLEGVAGDAVPFVRGLFDTILDTVPVAVLSIYLLDLARPAGYVGMPRNRP